VHRDSVLLAQATSAGRKLRDLSRTVMTGSRQYRVLSGAH
jgi:hypothetical protein